MDRSTEPDSKPESQSEDSKKTLTIDEAIAQLHQQQQQSNEPSPALALVLQEVASTREKVTKLKSLLGRSAKAQREAKLELDVTQKRLDAALREGTSLKQQLKQLSTRPTHMELLADFETNFDKAMLSVNASADHQAGGEDTAPTKEATASSAPVVDTLIIQELTEARRRIEKLTSIQSTLTSRNAGLEEQVQGALDTQKELEQTIQRLELEKRMADLQITTANQEKEQQAALVQEMQLEIDLVTKASAAANQRAAAAAHTQISAEQVEELQAQVTALREWALASAESKRLAQERVRMLEAQVKRRANASNDGDPDRRVLSTLQGSVVVGAGDMGIRVLQLTIDEVKSVRLSERVLLIWKFDLCGSGEVPFWIAHGKHETNRAASRADKLLPSRVVHAGAAGEVTEGVFRTDRACTFVWDNTSSWIRPKTIKYQVQAVVVADE